MAQYIYGKNTVYQRLQSAPVEKLFLLQSKPWPEFEVLAKKEGISIAYVTKEKLDKMVQGVHQGVIAQIKEYQFAQLDDVLRHIDSAKTPLIVMCDGLEDPHNLGAILRTADATGVDGVIIGKHRSVSLTATVAKVSVGAIETIPVVQVINLTQTLKDLKKKGFWVCGTDKENAMDYRKADFKMPLVLVIGSEGFGLSRLVKEQCDFMVAIPMVGKVTSLNASVATGVLLYEVYAQRNPI